jgi:hypothetical protein
VRKDEWDRCAVHSKENGYLGVVRMYPALYIPSSSKPMEQDGLFLKKVYQCST